MKRRQVLKAGVAFAGLAAAVGLDVTPAEAADPLPATVPSLREAIPGTGAGFSWNGAGRIVVNGSADGRLTADARTFASDLAGLFGGPAPAVVNGAPSTAQPGDISLSLGSTDSRLGTEGYGMTIGPVLSISAPTETGAFWGTRTVLQMLRQRRTLPATTIADWPRYRVRAISVSLGGFPAGWFTNLVRDMSYVKLNELLAPSALAGLTDAQILRIQQVAEQYHVKFVGWINTLHYNGNVPPDYQLRVANQSGVVAKSPTTLDITKPAAIAWAKAPIDRYMRLQTAPHWHAGGDEYPMWYLRNDKVTAANAPDLYAVAKAKYPSEQFPAAALYNEVMNQINDLAKSHGKQMWIWNDDLVPTTTMKLDSDVVVDHWINYAPALKPAQLVAAGQHLINSNQDHLYFDEHYPGGKNATDTDLWTTFDPGVFHGGLTIPQGGDNPNLDGIKLNTWHGRMQEPPGPLELDLLILNRPLAERAWAHAKPTTSISTARTLFAAIGRAPGVVQTPAAGDPGTSSLTGSPAVTYRGSQQVFFVGTDGRLRHRFWMAGFPSVVEEPLATTAPVTGRPVAYVPTNNHLHAFVRGTDGTVQHTWYNPDDSTWRHDDWSALTGTPGSLLTGDLAGFAYGTQQHVFARGTDGRLRHFFYDAGTRRVTVQDWGGDIAGDPVAYVWGKVQNVFAVGFDGALHRWSWQPSDGQHVHHRNLGGTFASDARPAGVGFLEAVQDVVIRDTSNHLQLWRYDHATGIEGWRDLTTDTGVTAAGDPAEYVYGTSQAAERHIFVRNAADSHLMHFTFRQSGSVSVDDWTVNAIGDPNLAVSDPFGFNVNNTERHAFATNSAGKMHHWFWLSGDQKIHQDDWSGR